jgi:hypothetical protein
MSQRTAAVRIDLCVYMDGLSSVGSVDCWKRERERERDGPELAGQYITCYELVDFQRTSTREQRIRTSWPGCGRLLGRPDTLFND